MIGNEIRYSIDFGLEQFHELHASVCPLHATLIEISLQGGLAPLAPARVKKTPSRSKRTRFTQETCEAICRRYVTNYLTQAYPTDKLGDKAVAPRPRCD
jgi:hypothetical protein